MTRRDLEYIYNHYQASMGRFVKNCVNRKCKKCPFADKNYESYCSLTVNIREAMKTIRDFLMETA
jgi:hypothetical protein